MTNDQDLQTIFRASEMALLSGADRDVVRQAAQRLDAVLKEVEAQKAASCEGSAP